MVSAKETVIEKLKNNGVKLTPQRIAILEYFDSNLKMHHSAEEVYQALKPKYPSLSLATIYNTLDKLEEINVLMKLKISDDNKVYYDYDTSIHHHFYCKECQQIFDVHTDCQIGRAGAVNGHSVEEVHGYFKGICKNCKK